jgi:hypothetical protein
MKPLQDPEMHSPSALTPVKRRRRPTLTTAPSVQSATLEAQTVETEAVAAIRSAGAKVDRLAVGIEAAVDSQARSVGDRVAESVRRAPAVMLRQATDSLNSGGLGDDALSGFLVRLGSICGGTSDTTP